MVKVPGRLVQPGNECDCCQRRFKAGDRCVVVVRVPDGGYDTLCLEDWATILAACQVTMEQADEDDSGVLKKTLRAIADRMIIAMPT